MLRAGGIQRQGLTHICLYLFVCVWTSRDALWKNTHAPLTSQARCTVCVCVCVCICCLFPFFYLYHTLRCWTLTPTRTHTHEEADIKKIIIQRNLPGLNHFSHVPLHFYVEHMFLTRFGIGSKIEKYGWKHILGMISLFSCLLYYCMIYYIIICFIIDRRFRANSSHLQ